MAIRLEGILNTVAGATTGSYIRIEYVKYMPWVGTIEYTPMCFKNELEADMSRIRYFGDELPAATFPIPHMSMSLESGSFTGDLEIEYTMTLPLTGALQDVNIKHYGTAINSASVDVTDFDDDGNEVTTQQIMTWEEFGIVSESIEQKHPIDLSRSGSLLSQCYAHLKETLAEQIPAESILDV